MPPKGHPFSKQLACHIPSNLRHLRRLQRESPKSEFVFVSERGATVVCLMTSPRQQGLDICFRRYL